MTIHSTIRRLVFLLLILGSTAISARAQYTNSFGLGAQLGGPTGISMIWDRPSSLSYDLTVAWDVDDFLFVDLHGIIRDSFVYIEDHALYLFYGPGGFLEFRDRNRHENRFGNDDVFVGVSAMAGVGYGYQDWSFFLRMTPRLSIVPGTDFDFGGGIGFRYHFF
jgi:hypothetical protein